MLAIREKTSAMGKAHQTACLLYTSNDKPWKGRIRAGIAADRALQKFLAAIVKYRQLQREGGDFQNPQGV